jgi:hypothetical protein
MEYDRLERTRATEESLRERLETQVYADSSPLQRARLGAGSRAGRFGAPWSASACAGKGRGRVRAWERAAAGRDGPSGRAETAAAARLESTAAARPRGPCVCACACATGKGGARGGGGTGERGVENGLSQSGSGGQARLTQSLKEIDQLRQVRVPLEYRRAPVLLMRSAGLRPPVRACPRRALAIGRLRLPARGCVRRQRQARDRRRTRSTATSSACLRTSATCCTRR